MAKLHKWTFERVICISRKRMTSEEKAAQDKLVKQKLKGAPEPLVFQFVVNEPQIVQISPHNATFDLKNIVDPKKKQYIRIKSIEQTGCVSPCDLKTNKDGKIIAVENVNKWKSEYRMVKIPYRRIGYDGPLVVYDLKTNLPIKTLTTKQEMIDFFKKFTQIKVDGFKTPKLFGR